MRIVQIQFEPVDIPCLFSPDAKHIISLDTAESVNVELVKSSKPKKTRRPKLQRQNAIHEDNDAEGEKLQSDAMDVNIII